MIFEEEHQQKKKYLGGLGHAWFHFFLFSFSQAIKWLVVNALRRRLECRPAVKGSWLMVDENRLAFGTSGSRPPDVLAPRKHACYFSTPFAGDVDIVGTLTQKNEPGTTTERPTKQATLQKLPRKNVITLPPWHMPLLANNNNNNSKQ